MSAQFTLFFVAAIKVMSLWVVWMKLTPAKEMIGVSLESFDEASLALLQILPFLVAEAQVRPYQ